MFVTNHQRRAYILVSVGDFPAVPMNPGETVEIADENWNGLYDGIQVIRSLVAMKHLEAKRSGNTEAVIREGALENPPSPKPKSSGGALADGRVKRTGTMETSTVEVG